MDLIHKKYDEDTNLKLIYARTSMILKHEINSRNKIVSINIIDVLLVVTESTRKLE